MPDGKRGTLVAAVREAADTITEEYRQRGYFPHAAVSVFTPEQTLYRAAYGGVTADTLFDAASLTKILTSTQVLLLIGQGKFGLDDCILTLLPEAAKRKATVQRLEDVTVRKLLTHTSGIVDWYPFYAEPGGFYDVLDKVLPMYERRQGVVYSDINFMLLGLLVEKITGLPLKECLRVHLGGSLSQPRLCYCPDPSLPIAPSCYGNPIEEDMCRERGIAFSGWRPHEEVRGQVNDGNAFYFFGGVAGHAGAFADVAAYEALCRLYLTTDSPLLIEAVQEQAPGRGLGFARGDMYPAGCGHTGFTGTAVYLSRELKVGVAAFTNRLFYPHRNPNATQDYRRALFRAVADIMTSEGR